MKKQIQFIVISVLALACNACSDWLDVHPSDTLTQDELYADGDGYRVTLNGIYKQMSEPALYGSNLTWGYLDAAAQMYTPYALGSGSTLHKFANYQYTDSKVEDAIETIWSTAYNSIANCNALLAGLASAPASKFRDGQEEKDLIQGEALALRAFLHFDILRLFAPAPIHDDGKAHVPYVNEYPCLFKEYIGNREMLEHIIADLQEAQKLVAPFDTAEEHQKWMSTYARIENYQGSIDGGAPKDIFYTYRAFRMNYYAICAALARVYNYAAVYNKAYHEAAFRETETILAGTNEGEPFFNFSTNGVGTTDTYGGGNTKMYNDIIFCLSNQDLATDYAATSSEGGNTSLYLNGINSYADEVYDDASDIRRTALTAGSNNVTSLKYSEKSNPYCIDLIPMLRLSEMYYIRAEYYKVAQANDNLAAQALDAVREGRNCTINTYPPLIADNPEGWFNEELAKEAHREFVGEGQLFFYYKRLGLEPDPYTTGNYVFPLPDNENDI